MQLRHLIAVVVAGALGAAAIAWRDGRAPEPPPEPSASFSCPGLARSTPRGSGRPELVGADAAEPARRIADPPRICAAGARCCADPR